MKHDYQIVTAAEAGARRTQMGSDTISAQDQRPLSHGAAHATRPAPALQASVHRYSLRDGSNIARVLTAPVVVDVHAVGEAEVGAQMLEAVHSIMPSAS